MATRDVKFESVADYEPDPHRSLKQNPHAPQADNNAKRQGEAADKDKLLLSIYEALKLLNIGETLLKNLIRSGEIRSVKIGTGRGRRLISRAALEEFIANNETGGWK